MTKASKDTSAGADIQRLGRLAALCNDCSVFAGYARVEYEQCVYVYDDLGGFSPSPRRGLDEDDWNDERACFAARLDPAEYITEKVDSATRYHKNFVDRLRSFDATLGEALKLRLELNVTLGGLVMDK